MAQIAKTGIPQDGLAFFIDQYNRKSYRGAPVFNLAWNTNPRIDATYNRRNYNPGGTYPQFHNDAIIVYNNDGGDITNYDNSGVTDWTNTRHAKWVYDGELGEPVVTMQNYTDGGAWKAKTWGMYNGSDWAANGLPNVGDRYTVSWLQWVSTTSITADAGLYYYNSSFGYYNFWDGQARNQGTAYNTQPRTWQRVYATYTRGSNSSTISGWYCYGMNTGTGETRMADVQVNSGENAIYTGVRSLTNTQNIVDLTGNATCTANNLTYRPYNFDFTTSNGVVDIGRPTSLTSIGGTSAITVACWTNFYSHASPSGQSYSVVTNSGNPWTWLMENPSNTMRFRINAGGSDVNVSDTSTFNTNQWYFWVGTYDGATMRIYRNGVQTNSVAQTGVLGSPSTTFKIGQYEGNTYAMNGRVGQLSIYNRALSASEILNYYNATKGTYGL